MSYENPHECVSKIDLGQAIASTKNVLRPPRCNCSINSFYEEMGGIGTMRKGMTIALFGRFDKSKLELCYLQCEQLYKQNKVSARSTEAGVTLSNEFALATCTDECMV